MGRKILMLAYYFPPCGASGTFRSLGFARNLVRMGWDVSVLSASEYLRESRDSSLLAKVPAEVELRNARVYDPLSLWKNMKTIFMSKCSGDERREASSIAQPSNFRARASLKDQITRFLKTPDNSIGWLFPALKAALGMSKPDLVYSSAPPFTSHLVGFFLKKYWRVPLVTDFRDPWIDNPFRIHSDGVVDRWNRFLEATVFRASDLVIANTPQMGEGFSQKYPQYSTKIRVVTNGFDPEDFLDIKPLREEPKSSLLLLHPGSLYGQRNPINFLRALKHVVAEGCTNLRIHFIGPCENFEGKSIAEHINCLGLNDYVKLSPSIGHREVLSLMKGADGLLLFSQGTDIQVPAKIFEYMALQKPIVAVCEENSATEDILRRLPDRHFCARNDVQAISSILTSFHGAAKELGGSMAGTENSPFERSLLTRALSGYLEDLLVVKAG